LRAVSQLAQRIGGEAGIRIKVEITGSPLAFGAETEGSLLMLIREALQNAVRHAAPQNVSVSLRFDRRSLQVAIEDDGRGFDLAAEHSGDRHHYGLIGMQERAEKLGGEFRLSSSPGKGTQVRLSIPLASSAR